MMRNIKDLRDYAIRATVEIIAHRYREWADIFERQAPGVNQNARPDLRFVARRMRVDTSDMSSTLFSSTVCPVDFSDYSLRALRYAIVLAGRFDGRVTVLYVANPLLQAAATAYDVAAINTDAEEELRSWADAVTSQAGAARAEIRTVVRLGDPATEIISCGEEEHADLIVMGTHGRSGYRRMFFGSVTEQVLRRSSVPVLAVPPSDLEHGEAVAEASMVSGEDRHL